jgi:fumarate reductase flavoprotein subunit
MKSAKFMASILLMVVLLSASALWAAANEPFLANAHQTKGLSCAACHGEKMDVDDNETIVNAKCTQCHGSLAKVAEKSREAVNAHKSHLGGMNCTVCHAGHTESVTYCLNCHNFDLKIPFGKIAARVPSVALPVVEKVPGNIRTDKADIVIIGAGATGFTAAITAQDKGAKVVLLEKMPVTGGNSQLAAGGMNAAETRIQKEKGIKDSVELMYQDTMKGGKNVSDPELVKILASQSAAAVDWLTSIGADLSDVGRLGGASVARAHRPSGGAAVGAHITKILKKNAEDRKIDVRVNSRVIKILEDSNGHVTGVLVQGKHSKLYRISARAVIIATGGFSANPERVAYYQPAFKGMTTSNQPGATGDGMTLGAAAGGYLIDMKEIQIHPTVAAGSRILITEAVRGNGAILVNREGKRFVNEMTTRDAASAAILAQTGKSAFLIFDDGIRKSLKQIEGYFHLNLVISGNTIADLAAKIKAPAAELEATINAYNKAVEEKNDAAFKRPDLPRSLKTPGFYAIEIMPGVHYTMGGLKVNTNAQVMAKDGKPIPGLFAAGEGTGGVHGANRLGGNSIAQTIAFGRIVGENAVKFVK